MTSRGEAILAYASRAVAVAVRTGAPAPPPPPAPPGGPPRGPRGPRRRRGDGGGRGGVGRAPGFEVLGRALASMAASAALDDPRFPPVQERELADLTVEVSLLRFTGPGLGPSPEPLSALRVGVHGLRIEHRGRSGLLLPQVAEEHGLDARGFLDALCRKAGLSPGAWSEPGAVVSLFSAEVLGPVPVV